MRAMSLLVYKPVWVFQQSERGLFFLDTSATGTVLINTVAENRSRYTNHDYSLAVLARKLQQILGRPSTRSYLYIVEKYLLPNCPVTCRDIVAAENIFGPDVGSLKGKTVRRPGDPVADHIVDVPPGILTQDHGVLLGGDIMFVNKIPFFMTISRYIKFGTAEMLQIAKIRLSSLQSNT